MVRPKKAKRAGRVECDRCSFCVKKENLARHYKDVHAEKRFVCRHCPATFTVYFGLKRHIKKRHEAETTFACEVCIFRTKRKASLEAHQRRSHASSQEYREERVNCESCHKMIRRDCIMKHKRRVHLRQRDFECPLCKSVFFSRGELASHTLRNHRLGKKK